jgi:type VI secretion system protein ImpK
MSTDDPFRPKDATVLRPRPGAGRRTANDAPAYGQPPAYGPAPSAAAPSAYRAEPAAPIALDKLGIGLNPLVQAASGLLLLAGRIRGTLQGDVAALRQQVLDELRRYQDRARTAGIANEVVVAARYALCTVLDEAVLSTPWGAQSDWAQQSLLITLHREAWGGEKFFAMLEHVQQDPARHIDLMELMYLCLAMGFGGKYLVAERGHQRLAEIQQDLYRRIRQFRGNPEPELSLKWQGVEDRRNPLVRYVPWWVIGAASLAVVALAFVFFYVKLGAETAPVQAQLAQIGLADFTSPVGPIRSGPTLKELLVAEEERGVLTVEEEGGRTLITLTARDLFASGSAKVNPSYYDTLQRIANALDRIPGRVLVIGHTDDQPLRSIKYRDNFELSRERAVSVVNILKLAIDQPARLEYTGVGSTDPRYRPESTPENRARNRRVEIVHVAEAS